MLISAGASAQTGLTEFDREIAGQLADASVAVGDVSDKEAAKKHWMEQIQAGYNDNLNLNPEVGQARLAVTHGNQFFDLTAEMDQRSMRHSAQIIAATEFPEIKDDPALAQARTLEERTKLIDARNKAIAARNKAIDDRVDELVNLRTKALAGIPPIAVHRFRALGMATNRLLDIRLEDAKASVVSSAYGQLRELKKKLELKDKAEGSTRNSRMLNNFWLSGLGRRSASLEADLDNKILAHQTAMASKDFEGLPQPYQARVHVRFMRWVVNKLTVVGQRYDSRIELDRTRVAREDFLPKTLPDLARPPGISLERRLQTGAYMFREAAGIMF